MAVSGTNLYHNPPLAVWTNLAWPGVDDPRTFAAVFTLAN
jgi:hypothetical protein